MITTKIVAIERMRSSEAGNPRYRLATTAGIYRTAPNASIAYALGDWVLHREAELTLDRRGNVIDVSVLLARQP